MMKKIFFILVLLCVGLTTKAQDPAQKNKLVTRPTIMVFPFVKEGEDIRTILEKDFNLRIIITKVKEAFDSRGYSTVDFLSIVRNNDVNQQLNDAQTDIKTLIMQSSGADIAIEVEYAINKSSLGTSVTVILTAYETSSSASFSNKIGESNIIQTENIGALASRATESIIEDFLNVLQTKFDDVVENGKYINIQFGLVEGTSLTMATEVGTDNLPLSDALEEWISENSNSYHIKWMSEKGISFDQIRIPRTKAGKNYTSTAYRLDILRFCRSLTLSKNPGQKIGSENFVKGSTIFINFKNSL